MNSKKTASGHKFISILLIGSQILSFPVYAGEMQALGFSAPTQPAISPEAAAEKMATNADNLMPRPNTSLDLVSPLSAPDLSLQAPTIDQVIAKIKKELRSERIDLSKTTFTTNPSPAGLYAVTATEQEYPGKSHFFVFNSSLNNLLRYDSDVFSPSRKIVFDSTKLTVLILRGNIYNYPDGSQSLGSLTAFRLNGTNTGTFIGNVSQAGTTMIDPAGASLIVESFERISLGSKKITVNISASATTIVSVEEPYISAANLATFPTALTNSNYALQTIKSSSGNAESYNVYNKITGKFVANFIKKSDNSVPGSRIETISVPDVSQDGKYLIHFHTSYDSRSSAPTQQILKIYDAVTGAFIKTITIEPLATRTAINAKTVVQNGENRVLVTFANGTTQSILIETPQEHAVRQIKKELSAEGVNISTLSFTTTPSPAGLYAATATESVYPGKAYFFVFNNSVNKVLRYDSDVFTPTRKIVFDSTKLTVLILRGTIYNYPDGSQSLGGLTAFRLDGTNRGTFIGSVSQTGTTIIDPAGASLIVESFERNSLGSKKITVNISASATTIVSVEEPYISAANLATYPTALTNSNYALQTIKSSSGNSESYNVYNKITGKFVANFIKKSDNSVPGSRIETISVPDVSQDGKYLIHFHTSYDSRSSAPAQQLIRVYDAVTGVYIKQINIEPVLTRRAASAKTIIQNGKNAVLVTYLDGTTKTWVL